MATPIPVIPYKDPFQNPQFGIDETGQFGQTGQNLTINPLSTPGVPLSPPIPAPSGPPPSSSSSGPTPTIVKNFEIKSKLLRPALTSHYVCRFQPPARARNFLKQGEGLFPGSDYSIRGNQELIEISCSEASLPGSSLITNEINDDYTGVTERPAYRRQYDDRIDFTFYVDHRYGIINFFERWISYCVGENLQTQLQDRNYSYRVNFPEDYQTDDLYITKFERDYQSQLQYKFIGAYPISIASMPISYDSSELLKCTVSFSYIRYVRNVYSTASSQEPGPVPSPGIPQNPIFDNPEFGVDTTGQFGQTGFNLNQNPLGTNPGQINPGSGGLVP